MLPESLKLDSTSFRSRHYKQVSDLSWHYKLGCLRV